MSDEPKTVDVTAEYVLELQGLDQEDLVRILGSHQAYQAIALALLRQEAPAIEYLRGIARIGLEAPPQLPWQQFMQRDVLQTLDRLGVSPLTRDEMRVHIAQMAQNVVTRLGDPGERSN